jgi:hypothetical protein
MTELDRLIKPRGRFRDLAGMRFGKLTAIAPVGKNKSKQYLWQCKCDCGGSSIVIGSNLIRGNTTACGCVRLTEIADRTRKHGLSKTRMFKIWVGIRKRCNTPSCKSYEHYGGRGIKVCAEWDTFLGFYNDMKDGYEENLSLERKDPDGDYTKSNCKWATMKEQARNKRNSVYIEYDGQNRTCAEWADISGTGSSTIRWRMKMGWSIQESIFGKATNTTIQDVSKYLIH